MEEWQIAHVNDNLTELIQYIDCNVITLAELISLHSLSKEDESTLISMSIQQEKSRRLLDILITRTNGYENLTHVLFKTKQTGALKILMDGYEIHKTSNPMKLCKIRLDFSSLNLTSHEWQLLRPELMAKSVNILNKRSLEDIEKDIGEALYAIIRELLQEDQKLLDKIFYSTSQIIPVINENIHEALSYYIPRTLSLRQTLSPMAFHASIKDIFLFEDTNRSYLSNIAGEPGTATSDSQITKLTKRFILLKTHDHFLEICNIASDPVHHIKYAAGKFILLQSCGGLHGIQEFILPDEDVFDEKVVIEKCFADDASAVCISDTPGMGKSYLLSSMGRYIQDKHPTRIVLFMLLRELVQEVENSREITPEFVRNLIASQAAENAFGRKLLVELFKHPTYQVELFLDGFDELLREQLPQAKKIIKLLISRAAIKNIRVFVTTRPHMKQELENVIYSVSYNIQPFQPENQIEFLVKYWIDKCGLQEETPDLREYAAKCLQKLHKRMTDSEKNITGVPMQCMLLAEVNSGAIKNSSTEIIFSSDKYNSAIFGMYETLMEKRFTAVDEKQRTMCKDAHTLLALNLLFPAQIELFAKYLECSLVENENLYSAGILEKPNFRFLHRTYAEYLLAEFFVEVMKKPSFKDSSSNGNGSFFSSIVFGTTEKYIHLFKNKIFSEFDYIESYELDYPVLCYFINAHMAKQSLTCSKLPGLSSSLNQSFIHYPLRFYKILAACATRDFGGLLSAVKNCYPIEVSNRNFVQLSKTKLPWTDILLVATRYSSLELLQEACQLVEKVRRKPLHEMKFRNFPKLTFMVTPLHVGMGRGDYAIVEYLLENYKKCLPKVKSLIHFCVAGSSHQTKNIIKDKMQIIELLHGMEPKLLNEKDTFDSQSRTPIFMEDIHIDLIKHLLNSDSTLYHSVTYPNFNIAHHAAKYLTSDAYHQLVQFLVQKNEAHLFHARDWIDCTPIHRAIQCLVLNSETLELLHGAANVDFNKEDKHGNTELFYAIRCGHGKNIIQTIVNLGGYWKKKDKIQQSVLHLAALYGNVEALEYFLDLGANIEAKDADQMSPLLVALRYGIKNVHEIVKLLIDFGADVHAYDTELMTAVRIRKKFPEKFEERTIGLIDRAEQKAKAGRRRLVSLRESFH